METPTNLPKCDEVTGSNHNVTYPYHQHQQKEPIHDGQADGDTQIMEQKQESTALKESAVTSHHDDSPHFG